MSKRTRVRAHTCSTLYAIATFFPPSGCQEMLPHTRHTSRATIHTHWHVTIYTGALADLVTLLLGVQGSLNTVNVLALGGLPVGV